MTEQSMQERVAAMQDAVKRLEREARAHEREARAKSAERAELKDQLQQLGESHAIQTGLQQLEQIKRAAADAGALAQQHSQSVKTQVDTLAAMIQQAEKLITRLEAALQQANEQTES